MFVVADPDENTMRKLDLTTMQFEELLQLHEELTKLLAEKVVAEKRELEDRLAKLNRIEIVREPGGAGRDRGPRRKYPKVLPKYCNPLAPSQKWSGRGKKPRWVVAALETGQRLDDLRIEHVIKKRARKERSRSRH